MFLSTEILPILQSYLDHSEKQYPVSIFYRIYGGLGSITRLNKPEDFQSVAILTRAAFEQYIDLLLVIEGKIEDASSKIDAFVYLDRFRSCQQIVEFVSKYPQYKSDFVDLNIIWNFYDSNKANYINTHKMKSWSGKTFKDSVEMLGTDMECLYYRIYKLLSWYVHSGFSGIQGLSEDSLKAVYGLSLGYFLHIIEKGYNVLASYLNSPIINPKIISYTDWLIKHPKILNDLSRSTNT